jgi:hypothetical protein
MRIQIKRVTDKQPALLLDAWIRTWMTSSSLGRDVVDTGARRAIERILTRPTTEVLSAVNVDKGRIDGLAVVDRQLGVLHFIWVRSESRQFGVAKALLAGLPSPLRVWWLARGADRVGRAAAIRFDPWRCWCSRSN